MADEDGTGSNAVWAIALVIIVAIIGAVVYFLVLKGPAPKTGGTAVDVDVSLPAR
jgi:hypothetical protein